MRRLPPAVLIFALILVPAALVAYGTLVHDAMPHEILGLARAPSGGMVDTASAGPVADADLARFRSWLYARAARLPDTALRRAFLARYPSAAAFTPAAFKEFMMMNGTAAVLGVDSFAAVDRQLGTNRALDPHPPSRAGAPLTVRLALELGSDFVDLDRRNENRLLRDSLGRAVLTPPGDTVPFDPMTLNMGNRTGTSSQAWAHYGFNHHPKSSDPGVLRSRPWDFAVPIGFGDSVETFAEPNAQAYTDLAYLALLEGGHGSRGLSVLYAGNAFHYVEDVGNAIHTLQAGIFGFFVDATLYRVWRQVITIGGLLGPVPSRNSAGLAIITSHHLMSERLFERELMAALREERANPAVIGPSMKEALDQLHHGNPRFAAVLAHALDSARSASGACDCPPVGQVVTAAIIADGNEDGALIYQLTRRLGTRRMRRPPAIDFDTLPPDAVWTFVSDTGSTRTHGTLDEFNRAQARGLGRVHEALDAWWAEYLRMAATPPRERGALTERIVTRLVAARLAYLDAAEARRRQWCVEHGAQCR